jgi:iron complex outermembrane receptor protein
MVRGKNKSESTDLPRIPASRIGFGYEVQTEKLTFGMNLTRVFKQDRIPVHEEDDDHGDDEHGHEPTPTDAYTTLDAYASYDLTFGNTDGEFFIRGNNLTDELAKSHTSFVKDYAPPCGCQCGGWSGFRFLIVQATKLA